jgi:hypothetical protein
MVRLMGKGVGLTNGEGVVVRLMGKGWWFGQWGRGFGLTNGEGVVV